MPGKPLIRPADFIYIEDYALSHPREVIVCPVDRRGRPINEVSKAYWSRWASSESAGVNGYPEVRKGKGFDRRYVMPLKLPLHKGSTSPIAQVAAVARAFGPGAGVTVAAGWDRVGERKAKVAWPGDILPPPLYELHRQIAPVSDRHRVTLRFLLALLIQGQGSGFSAIEGFDGKIEWVLGSGLFEYGDFGPLANDPEDDQEPPAVKARAIGNVSERTQMMRDYKAAETLVASGWVYNPSSDWLSAYLCSRGSLSMPVVREPATGVYEVLELLCRPSCKGAAGMREIAEATGVPIRTLQDWKAGATTPPRQALLEIIERLGLGIKAAVCLLGTCGYCFNRHKEYERGIEQRCLERAGWGEVELLNLIRERMREKSSPKTAEDYSFAVINGHPLSVDGMLLAAELEAQGIADFSKPSPEEPFGD